MDKIRELKDKRAKLVADQRAMLDKAEAEKRSLTPEEDEQYAKMEADFDTLSTEIKTEIEAQEKRDQRKADLESRENQLKESDHEPIKPVADPEVRNNIENRMGSHVMELATLSYSERLKRALEGWRKQTGNKYATNDYDQTFRNYLAYGLKGLKGGEERALQADLDQYGGFLVTPEQFVAQLIQAKDNLVFCRRLGNVIPVPNAASLGVPALDTDMAAPDWTSEIKTGSVDSSLDFNKRELYPHPLAKRIKVSKKLLRVAVMSIDSIIRERMSYQHAVTEENAFLNGNGVDQPLGVFVASANGISTGRDVTTTKSAMFTADDFISVKYTLPAQYRNSGSIRWCFHRDSLAKIRKLKDGEGNYLWKQGLSDRPDTILEIPFEESEYAPSTFSSSAYIAVLGDWRYYWIADALNMTIQVLTELYAETNQNGYISRAETDGMPVLENAFVRMKLL